MKERRRAPKRIKLSEKYGLVILEENENVVAFCTTHSCRSVLFKGSDKTQIGHRVLRESVLEHIGSFEDPHDVEIIYPRRKRPERVITSEAVLQKLTFLKISGQLLPKRPPLQ